MYNREEKDTRSNVLLTRGTKKLIAEAIKETKSLNSRVICESICDSLCDKFTGNSLDYQLERMNIGTTKSILDAIDVFIYKNANASGLKISDKTTN